MDFERAKEILSQPSPTSGLTLYEHLSRVVRLILDETPPSNLDTFEELSFRVKETLLETEDSTLWEEFTPTEQLAGAMKLKTFFSNKPEGDPSILEDMPPAPEEMEETPEPNFPNTLELLFYFEQCGVGLPRDEMFAINLALKNLAGQFPINSLRFWGKILGIDKNYIVAEAEMNDAEAFEDEEIDEEQQVIEENVEKVEEEEEEELSPMDTLPVSAYKPPVKVPSEPPGTGINKKIFFVCNEPGDPWIRLPHVTPEQITLARKIKKYFSGHLDQEVHCYPPFPGVEANYLRAQIGRISAGTQISPVGFYMFGEEDEDEEEGGGATAYIENPDFEPLQISELLDTTLVSWVHHSLHILTQGRTRWWNPKKGKGEDEEDIGVEEEEEEEEIVPEEGPPLLSPISEDAPFDKTPPWSVMISSNLIPEYAVAVVKSNLWPGAYAFAKGRKFENVYIGWGHKFTQMCYQPVLPDCPMKEYVPDSFELQEMDDPTPEEEEEFKRMQDVEEEEDEIEEEEDREEDDDDE